eukprot:8481571-Heterocapsa_arctica.AAC.1
MTDMRKTRTSPRIGMNKGETVNTEAQAFGNVSARWTDNTGGIKVRKKNISTIRKEAILFTFRKLWLKVLIEWRVTTSLRTAKLMQTVKGKKKEAK